MSRELSAGWQPHPTLPPTVRAVNSALPPIAPGGHHNHPDMAETEAFVPTAGRLERVGLMLDRTALSPANRRADFALQCLRCADRRGALTLSCCRADPRCTHNQAESTLDFSALLVY